MAVPDPKESPKNEDRPNRAQRWLSAGTTALLVALAGGGAATPEGGVAIGVPSLSFLALAGCAGALVWFSGITGLAGFLLPACAVFVAAPFLPASTPLLLFSGQPLIVWALAALVLAATALRKCPPKPLLLPAFFVLYAAVSYQVQSRVGPDGDEPQYLMVAESLIRDHDLVLDQDFAEKRYEAFFSRPLGPDFRIRGPEGQIYSLHAVGLSILILPAYGLGGYAGASFFMALVAALLVRELRRLVLALSGDAHLAEGTAWLIGLSPPLIHFAGLIFTEAPAALLLCAGLRTAVFGRTARSALAAAICGAALPWLNVRYSILAVAVASALAWRLLREARSLLPPATILAASAIAIALYHHALYGFFDPRRVYGRRREFSLDVLPEGLPGLFFDQEFGLLVYAPIFVLSLAGFIHLFRRERTLALAALFATASVIATASVWPMWRGGFNPPARFLVPLLPVLAATVSLSLQRGIRPSTALLAGWGLWCGLSGAMNIETIHRDRDGVAPFFRTQSGAREWTSALPSFVLPEDRPTRKLAAPWAILLSLPLLAALRPVGEKAKRLRNRDTLMTAAVFMTVAIFAEVLTPRISSPERDATRLLGSPSLLLPELRFESASEAAWTTDLFYEPHRSPQGFTFARGIRLHPGTYSVTLSGAEAVAADEMPTLLLTRRQTARPISAPMHAGIDGPEARIQIRAGGEFDLALKGGGPMTLSRVRLRESLEEF